MTTQVTDTNYLYVVDNSSDKDIKHYKKIIAALKRTEELMAEIDEVIEI